MSHVMWVLCHRVSGPIETFLKHQDAQEVLRRVLEDEPDWALDIWIEPFELVVAEHAEP